MKKNPIKPCSLETCIYHDFETAASLKKPYEIYTCPGCQKKVYHSEICAFNDHKHLSICRGKKYNFIKNSVVVRNFYGLNQALYICSSEVLIENDEILGIGGFASVRIFDFEISNFFVFWARKMRYRQSEPFGDRCVCPGSSH